MNQNKTNLAPGKGGSLDWLAFCYVADELETRERDEFEKRLETDHEAREGVVRAMEQSELIWLAVDSDRNSTSVKTNRKSRESVLARRSGVLAACAAALLLMVVGWAWYANQDQGATAGVSESESLAVAVAELFESDDIDEFFDEQMDEELDANGDPEEDEISDWMFIAMTDLEDSMEVIE